MTERDRATVRIDPAWIQLEIPNAGDHLRGEGLIQLDRIEVAGLEAGTLQRLLRSRNRTEPHAGWIDAGAGGGEHARYRTGIDSLRVRLGHHDQAGGAVIE